MNARADFHAPFFAAPLFDAPAPDDAADFARAVRETFGMTRSFTLGELGARGVMLACRDARPRSAGERDRIAALHAWAIRRAEQEAPARRLNY